MNHDLVPNSLATGCSCLFFISVNGRAWPHCARSARSIDIDLGLEFNPAKMISFNDHTHTRPSFNLSKDTCQTRIFWL